MDPLIILKVLWRHKWVALPIVLITALACGYALFLGPRTYESSQTYALAQPKLPTAMELEKNPSLAKLNQDNPYLRSTDSSLLSQVVIAQMSSAELAEELKAQSLSTEYKVEPLNSLTSGLVKITAAADSPDTAVATVTALDEHFSTILHDVQKINEADDMFLVTPIAVGTPYPAQEVVSSRIRTVIMAGVGGVVLLFAAVSIAQSVVLNRKNKAKAAENSDGGTEGAGSRDIMDSETGGDNTATITQLRNLESPTARTGQRRRSK